MDGTASPARLTVERNGPDDVRTRQMVVSLDGRRLVTLLFGDRTSREIPPGHHRLRVHNTLVWKTIEFDAAPDEHVRFRIVNRAGLGSMALVALFGVGPMFVKIERVPPAP
jgi:hypothetical protein